jgi:hypothetical protein
LIVLIPNISKTHSKNNRNLTDLDEQLGGSKVSQEAPTYADTAKKIRDFGVGLFPHLERPSDDTHNIGVEIQEVRPPKNRAKIACLKCQQQKKACGM